MVHPCGTGLMNPVRSSRYVLVKGSTGGVSELFKQTGEPCIAVLHSSGELLLSKGNVGIFLGQDGRISRKSSLTWSDSPIAVAFSHPYAVALLPNYIEIRSVQRVSANGLAQVRSSLGNCNFQLHLSASSQQSMSHCYQQVSVRGWNPSAGYRRSYACASNKHSQLRFAPGLRLALLQVLPLKGIAIAAPSAMEDGSVFVASGSDGINRLVPVPFRQQAEVLADLGEFQEALQLSQLVPDAVVSFWWMDTKCVYVYIIYT